MNCKFPLGLALVLTGASLVVGAQTNSQLAAPTNVWKYINYPFPANLSKEPFFLLSSGEECGQISRGLRLDIQNIVQGFRFIRTNGVTARLYRANGEICEPTWEGKKSLALPVAASTASSFPGEQLVPGVMTWFPWGTNTLGEAWIEVTIGSERYWLEIPYGFDRNPADPLPPAIPGGPPQFASAMKTLNEHDHIVRWENVEYDLGQFQHGCWLTLKQSNPFDAKSEVVLYRDPVVSWQSWNLYSPRTAVRILDGNGTGLYGRCVILHLNSDGLRRTDTFVFGRGANDIRCWGQIEVSVGDNTYGVVVPSSLYKYVHGHADKPAIIAYASTLRVGMTLAEADSLSRNYISDGIRHYPVSSTAGHEYRYVFPHDAGEITLRFDSSDHLVSWRASGL